jgi:beta-xylosidase
MFYVFANVNGAGLMVYRSKTINGPWEWNQLPGRHDMSVLFDDDGKVYIISGAGAPYPIDELNPDLRSFKADAPKRSLPERMGEGHHLYKIKGKYVDISCQPGGAVDEYVAVADSIDGPWKVTKMVTGESLGVPGTTPAKANANDRGLWLHQGGMCDTPSGQWWSTIMSDHGSAGRMISLVPITWDDGFPLIGLPGNLRKAPNTWIKPDTGLKQQPNSEIAHGSYLLTHAFSSHASEPTPTYVPDDNFNGGKMNPHWQWNHVPDDTKWSLTEKPGVLRLHSLPAANYYSARNSLCQRPPGPECIITVELGTTGLSVGDTAGLALLCNPYVWIGVVKSTNGTTLQLFQGSGGGGRRGGAAAPANTPVIGLTNPPSHLWLQVHCNFDTDQAIFSWSTDGKKFTPLGNPWSIPGFQLQTFQGVRPSLFNFNTTGKPGGYADFDNYAVVEPRARGIEREIPIGKTIALTSGADGSYLAADTQNNVLVNSTNATAQDTHFRVVDLGLGRVAFKASNGKFVSVAENGAILKDLAGHKLGDAESFQWINLMRGDTAFMTLVNHHYLTTKPNQPGPVTTTATDVTPARKGGVEFKWKTVE